MQIYLYPGETVREDLLKLKDQKDLSLNVTLNSFVSNLNALLFYFHGGRIFESAKTRQATQGRVKSLNKHIVDT